MTAHLSNKMEAWEAEGGGYNLLIEWAERVEVLCLFGDTPERSWYNWLRLRNLANATLEKLREDEWNRMGRRE